MPYASINDLPDTVTNSLPKEAQEIFLETYNSAWETYKEPEDRIGDDDRDTTSNKVAWAAVKNDYKKEHVGEWVKKDESDKSGN